MRMSRGRLTEKPRTINMRHVGMRAGHGKAYIHGIVWFGANMAGSALPAFLPNIISSESPLRSSRAERAMSYHRTSSVHLCSLSECRCRTGCYRGVVHLLSRGLLGRGIGYVRVN